MTNAYKCDIFALALQVVKQLKQTGDEDQQASRDSLKQACQQLDCNSKDRKKIFSLLGKYLQHSADLRNFRKQHHIRPKKEADLSKTMLDLILADRFYSHFDNSALFKQLPESQFLQQFDKQIAEYKRQHAQLNPLQNKNPESKSTKHKLDHSDPDYRKELRKKRRQQNEQEENDSNEQSTRNKHGTAARTGKNKQQERIQATAADVDVFANETQVPVKYLRVNRIKTSLEQVMRELINKHSFQQAGSRFDSFTAFLKRLFALGENEFLIDYHFPDDLIVVHESQKQFMQTLRQYEDGHVIFQDKACLLALKGIPLQAGFKIGDICCAPGMKTAAIASMLNNTCEMYSVDKDVPRMEVMKHLMDKLGVSCTQYINADFLECIKDDFDLPKISKHQDKKSASKQQKQKQRPFDVIFLDPSCSGSGILKRNGESNDDKERLLKLASFQTKLIAHAMRLYPRYIVYSTCSKSIWENEFVVCKALEQADNASDYELMNALPEWPQRGDAKFSCASKVIRTGPNRGTQGFFFAVFRLL